MIAGRASIYYVSAATAVLGTVGYHTLIKQIPHAIDPMVSIAGIYVGVLLFGLLSMPFIFHEAPIMESLRQLNWIQVGIGVCVLAMEIGFLMMYRSGWDVSVGNVVTGVFVNLALLTIGTLIFQERLNWPNVFGILVCIVGVAMVQYKAS